ncbi:biopolymer transporter ExbD, partial [Nostoc sp. NIES-2111]
ANTGQQSKSPEKITVTISSEGQVSVNRQPTTFDNLTEEIRSLVGNQQDVLVVINADEKANMGLAVTVMDKVRNIPGTKLAIATQKP